MQKIIFGLFLALAVGGYNVAAVAGSDVQV